MENPMLLQKTEKARLELLPGVRTLSLRERSLLLLVDGKPLSDLQAMYNGIGAQIVGPWLARDLVAAYLDAKFSTAEEFRRRVAKLADMDAGR
eukprot:gene1802-2363_t